MMSYSRYSVGWFTYDVVPLNYGCAIRLDRAVTDPKRMFDVPNERCQ